MAIIFDVILLVSLGVMVRCGGALDIDVQTCIRNFNVHQDKIIRTQDSQKMGAKYLSEFDLGSREECLRLCCETEDCDVFVFDEKNLGSCYLFQCGPPEDFKCKFTRHVNYSSGVLAINRHLPDLESQIKLTKHEQDLNKLRNPSYFVPSYNSEAAANPTTLAPSTRPPTTTLKIKEVLPVELQFQQKQQQQQQQQTTKSSPPEPVRKCSRFQFECRSNGECIAIYNACDGIPQCADGSDEGAELKCPDSFISTLSPPFVPRLPPPPPPPPPPSLPHLQQQTKTQVMVPQQQQSQQITPNFDQNPVPSSRQHSNGGGSGQESSPEFYRPQQPQQQQQQQISQQRIMPPYDLPAAQSNQNWDSGQVGDNLGQGGERRMNVPQQFVEASRHIFNHKENGIQVAPDKVVPDLRYIKPKGAMQYLHHALGYASKGQNQYQGETYPPHQKPSNYYNSYHQQWGQNVDPQYQYQPQYQNNWNQDPSQIDLRKIEDVNKKPEIPNNWVQNAPNHDQEQMVHELKHSKKFTPNENNIKSKPQNHSHKNNVIKPEENYVDVVEYKVTDEAQDGAAVTPGGAVLSLTLGLIMTCILALIIGCRLRVKRRMMRKGGKSYAHDADYLVNGMYL